MDCSRPSWPLSISSTIWSSWARRSSKPLAVGAGGSGCLGMRASLGIPRAARICYEEGMRRAACIVLLLLSACEDPARVYSGPELFVRQNCTTCHGPTGQGTPMAPSLSGAARNWTRADLIRYLKDPPAYIATNERLRVQASHYS